VVVAKAANRLRVLRAIQPAVSGLLNRHWHWCSSLVLMELTVNWHFDGAASKAN
jgi:hypothetical protein